MRNHLTIIGISIICLCSAMNLLSDELTARMVDEWSLVIEHESVGEISMNSMLTVANPSWTALHYYSRQMGDYWHENVPENSDGVSRLIQLADAKSQAYFHLIDYSARKTEHGSVLIHCAGERAHDFDAIVEYAALNLPKPLVDGARFTATLVDGQEISGTLPEEDGHSFLAEKCRLLVIDTKSCKITVEVKEGDPLSFLDRRLRGLEKGKCLFVGVVSRSLDTPLDSLIEVSVTPDNTQKRIEPLPQLELPPEKMLQQTGFPEKAPKAKAAFPQIVPKHYTAGTETVAEGLQFAVEFDERLGAEDQRRLKMAAEKLCDVNAPLSLKLATEQDNCHDHPDAFIISREPERIVVIGQTPRAIFYGIQTLREQNLSKTFRLEDWPDMDFRAIHCYFPFEMDDDTPEFFVENTWARSRLTHIILQCFETQWDTTKPLWQNRREKPPSKEAIEKLIQACRDNYIEPIPCLCLLSHCEWMFMDGHNVEFAENPEHYNYDVTNPKTFEFIDRLLEEILALFKPTILHIGHDEVDRARTLKYPTLPQNVALGQAELFYRSIMHLHDFLAERNVRTMFWCDGLISKTDSDSGNPVCAPDELTAFRARFPKDLLFAFWEYSVGRKYEVISELQKEGFDVIGCPWHKEENIASMVRAVKAQNAMGVCGTTWWPMYTWKYMADSFLPAQLTAQLMTPLLAWNAESNPDALAEQCADYLFASIANKFELEPKKASNGFMVNLDAMANYCPQNDDPILKADFTNALVPAQRMRIGRSEFLIPSRDGKLAGILFRNYPLAARFPQKLEVNCPKQAGEVHLLGGLLGTLPETVDCNTRVTFCYEDGSVNEQKLQFCYTMGHLQGRASYHLNPSNVLQGVGGRVWAMSCKNPEPDKMLSRIVLTAPAQGFILFGLTYETMQ
ncbi:MAG: beta-N-acetylhexosaminidase [Lentisphaeria bacterium]|nr:beta-N-acetylhexosaminidase [Lentisphaeria bacterium]